MFWIITAVVVAVGFALAWWSSGRAKPGRDIQRGVDMGGAEGKSRSQVTSNYVGGQPNGGGGAG